MKLSIVIISKLKHQSRPVMQSALGLQPQFLVDEANVALIGEKKNKLVREARGEWVMVLDTDELLSPELVEEIKRCLQKNDKGIHGYRIPYQNHVFGKPVYYGGERYSKVRLFRKKFGRVTTAAIHEEVEVEGRVVELDGKILHYSYRTPWQVISKFTRYAFLEAKRRQGEYVTLKKLFLYGPHMVWARLVKDQGYKDGWRGIFLAFAFGYMETLTFWLLFFL